MKPVKDLISGHFKIRRTHTPELVTAYSAYRALTRKIVQDTNVQEKLYPFIVQVLQHAFEEKKEKSITDILQSYVNNAELYATLITAPQQLELIAKQKEHAIAENVKAVGDRIRTMIYIPEGVRYLGDFRRENNTYVQPLEHWVEQFLFDGHDLQLFAWASLGGETNIKVFLTLSYIDYNQVHIGVSHIGVAAVDRQKQAVDITLTNTFNKHIGLRHLADVHMFLGQGFAEKMKERQVATLRKLWIQTVS